MTAQRSCGTSRSYDVSQFTTAQLERAKRELQVNLGLIGPHSLARVPVQAQMCAIDRELAERASNQKDNPRTERGC